LCSHSLLIGFITISIHFRGAIELATEELAEKAAKQWAPADDKAEQKGIWDEDKAIRAAERAKLKAFAG
jgi:ribosomal protein S20